MKNTNISALLKKADELRALFILGQKVIPFMEEVFVFVSEIQPLLDEINNSISENIKKMPNASKQLTQVSAATELATTEILDLVDGIFVNLDTIIAELDDIKSNIKQENQEIVHSLEELYTELDTINDITAIKKKIRVIIDYNSNKEKNQDKYVKIIEVIKTIQADSSSIMISLQVQDITSQQLAAVNKLLETLQFKLETVLEHFKDTDFSDLTINDGLDRQNCTQVSKLHREIVFDPNAVDSLINRDIRQNEIDEFIKTSSFNNINKNSNIEQTCQDDIDKLFAEQDINCPTNNSTKINHEPCSQDDIDKLFKKMD